MKIISIQTFGTCILKQIFFSWTFLFVKTSNKDDNEKAQYFYAFFNTEPVLAFITPADTKKSALKQFKAFQTNARTCPL